MSPVRALARPLLASVFVAEGLDALRNPGPRADRAEPVVEKVAEVAPPDAPTIDAEALTKVTGAVMVAGGALLALGKVPRLASAALAAAVVPTTLAEHRFWECSDPGERAAQQAHFTKNMGLLGGLALAAVDTEGRPGVAWRARHAAERVTDALPVG
jgi:uncharacterized membrane protein YphA (DoxX/SURF4 family)